MLGTFLVKINEPVLKNRGLTINDPEKYGNYLIGSLICSLIVYGIALVCSIREEQTKEETTTKK